MSCSIKDKQEAGISIAISKFVGNATSFEKVNDNTIAMKAGPKFTKNQLVLIAQKNIERVAAWANKEYGQDFQYGWVNIDSSVWNSVIVRFRIPPALSKSWQVQDNLISLEQANNDLSLPDVGNDFFMGDFLLAEQWERELSLESTEDNDFSESVLDLKTKEDFNYDKSLEVLNPHRINDDILNNMSNNINVC
jgi:hypothetical protein